MAYRVNASNWAMPGRSAGSAYAASEYTASELDPNGKLTGSQVDLIQLTCIYA